MKTVDNLSAYIDKTIKWFDKNMSDWFSSIIIPIAIYLFMIWGPTLSKDAHSNIVWRGGWLSFAVFLFVSIVTIRTYLRDKHKKQRMVHMSTITILFIFIAIFGLSHKQSEPYEIYYHYYWITVLIAMFVGIFGASWFGRLKYFKVESSLTIAIVKGAGANVSLVNMSNGKIDFREAFFFVLTKRILHVMVPVSIITLILPPYNNLWIFALIVFVILLLVFVVGGYDKYRNSMISLINHVFLTGGSRALTFGIFILAFLRAVNFDYVATILNASEGMTIASYIISLLLLFQLYDYWVNLTISDNVEYTINQLGIFHSKPHGGGRFLVTYDDGSYRILDPVGYCLNIAEIMPAGKIKEELIGLAKSISKKSMALSTICFAIFTLLVIVTFMGIHKGIPLLSPEDKTVMKTKEKGDFDLDSCLRSNGKSPLIMVAASGGGTRAALYSSAVLHGIQRLGKADNIRILSGVSGGSAACAYYAIYKDELKKTDSDGDWQKMRKILSSSFIDDVIAGCGELRILGQTGNGNLLSESFKKRFMDSASLTNEYTIDKIKEIGMIFNITICADSNGNNGTTKENAGGRMVVTNLSTNYDDAPSTSRYGWNLDFPFKTVNTCNCSIYKAASWSANFPLVFTNNAFTVDSSKYWVTDGGVLDNRGIVSILIMLNESLNRIKRGLTDRSRIDLPAIRIVLADVSSVQIKYDNYRGFDAVMSVSEKLNNRLTKDMLVESNRLYSEITGKDSGVQIVNLPMPNSMRIEGTFGTHWMLPREVTLKDSNRNIAIKINGSTLCEILDAMFSEEYSEAYIATRWKSLKKDASRIFELTGKQLDILESGLK
jgi:hypothetical protein